MVFERRHLSQPPSAAPANLATMEQAEQPPQADDSTRNRTTSRLKRMSDATVRRLSRPISLVSGRSSSPVRTNAQHKQQKSPAQNSIASHSTRAGRPPSSRRTSLLSTGRSSPAHDEEGLGELPVFGVSQRAYLASLVSLFTNSHGTPSSANTPITDPKSGASILGLHEYDIDSTAVYEYSKARRLYVGWPGIVHPPPEALLQFEMETLPLLERDLQGISGHLGQQGVRVTYELRMSGYASASAKTVSLVPTVWILYRAYSSVGAQVSVAELHQAVAAIFYLSRSPEIQEGGGRIELSSDRALVKVKLTEKERIELSDGSKLSVHIEDCQDKYSVCGALCCVTTEKASKQVQSLSRVGGLLKVNGKYVLGVSTSHAMLDGTGVFRDSCDESAKMKPSAGQAVDRDTILSETKRVSKWHNITRDAAVDFLGISMNSRGEMAINRSNPDNATDFALLRLRKIPPYVKNKYIPPRAKEPVSITSTASASSAAMDEGPVYIICGGGDVADGQLVWGSACFIVRGRNFRVRRIQTSRPLGAGTTGAWVVRGEVLYGVIIAVYENEPFALMMTIGRLFSSILGSAFSIRSVELWDGELPDALKTLDKGESPQTTKKIVPIKTRPRILTETHSTPNGEGPSRNNGHVNGHKTSSRPNTSPEGIQPLSPGPQTGDDAVQTEELCSPREDSEDLSSLKSKDDEESPGSARKFKATQATHPKPQGRPASHVSDVTMSGAVQDQLPVSNGKQRSVTGGTVVSTGPQTPTLNRQDSGFDSETPPPQTNGTLPETEPDGLQAPPIRPAQETNSAETRSGPAQDTNSNTNGPEPGDSNGAQDTSTAKTTPRSRRSSLSSLQAALGKTFRRPPSRKEQSKEKQDDKAEKSHTGLNRIRPLFHQRRFPAIPRLEVRVKK
ncbi:unnamed protein product [Discula destructiva]